MQRPRHRPRRAHDDGVFPGLPLHRADHLRVGRQFIGPRFVGRRPRHQGVRGAEPRIAGGKIRIDKAVATQSRTDLLQRDFRVTNKGLRASLASIIAVDVDRQQLAPRRRKHRPGPRREILKPGADTDHQIRLGRQLVPASGPRDTGRAEVELVFPIHRALARLRFHHRHVVQPRKVQQRRLRPRIDHAAARHDQRLFRRLDRRHSLGQLALIRLGPPDMPDMRGEKGLRIVISLGLRVLTERQTHRPAIRRIGHHPERPRQRGQDMFGARNAVEIPHHRAEAIVRADRPVVEILDLLQHRIGRAAGEDIARNDQQRQPVHMRQRRRRHDIRRPRPDRGRDRHRPPPLHRLGIGNRRMRHGLLVLAAPSRQRVAVGMQSLAHARDIAMPENRPDPVDEPLSLGRHLHRDIPHQRLRRRQPNRCHHFAPRASSQ